MTSSLNDSGTLYAVLHRDVSTNQRIFFDVSSCGQFVVSGGSDSKLRIWDLKSGKIVFTPINHVTIFKKVIF